jgi:hypothetical protein
MKYKRKGRKLLVSSLLKIIIDKTMDSSQRKEKDKKTNNLTRQYRWILKNKINHYNHLPQNKANIV